LRGNFFDLFSTALFQRLYDSHILEDSTGMLRTPKELAYTPPPYQNDSGCPLIPLAQIGGYDLAPEYESEDLDQFKALDVHFVTDEVFLDNLDIFLQKQSDCFREYESVWHAKIAEVLIPLVHAKYIDRLQSLELIPLSDGTWTRANNGQFFFDTADDGWPVPDGLSLSIVEVEAAADPTRHTLFTLLGAIQLGTSAIWNRIIKLHDSAAHIGDDMSRAALLSQIGFLFLSDWQFRHNHKLWVETDTGARVPGNVLYRDSQEPYSASHFFGQEHRSKFIHPDFTSAFPDRSQEWLVWLRDNVGIESTPRIVSESPGSSFTMHPDLELIVDSMDPLDVLLFLREYWDQIAHWIVTQDLEDTYSDAEHSRRQIRTKIGRMKVKCTNGKLVELSRTTLSLSDDSTGDYLIQSTLDIPDRDDPRWKFLRHFGAGRKRSLRTYIDSLEELSGHEASLDQVLYILEQIERCCSEDERSVRQVIGISQCAVANLNLVGICSAPSL
jgi:hypothetical protein